MRMNANQKVSMKTLMVLAVIMVLLVGCSNASNSNDTAAPNENASSSTETPKNETPASQEATTEYPIVIKHAFGETTIESKPERVATIQWANHDVALALGVVPVGFSAANYGVLDDSGMLPWTAEKLKELGVSEPNIFQDTDGLDFEAISDSNPDVILAAYSGITQEDYDILSQIAPVVAYQTTPWISTWREQVIFNATGMGMKAEGEQLIKDTENLIKEKAGKFPELQGKKVAFISLSPNDLSLVYVYTPADPRGGFLIELGMAFPQSIANEITDAGSFYLSVSAENADIFNDADLLVMYGDDKLYQALKADPLLGKIPAIQRGSVAIIGDGTPLAAAGTPNPLSISYTIDEFLDLVAGANKKLNE